MSQTVKVKGYGRAVFPDHFTKEQMRTALRKKFNNAAESTAGALDAAATVGSAAVAEPVSGLAGIGSSIYNMDANKGADTVKAVQDAMTYQPRTEKGQEYLQNVTEFVEPVANLIGSASQNLGDKAYAATGSPTLAAAAYSVPTAIAEGVGLKGLNIARKPVSKADLYAVRMGGGRVDNGMTVYRGVGEGSDDSIIKWVSPDENIAKGYAKARGGSVQKEVIEIKQPAMMGNASRRDKPSSLIASIIRDASKNEGFDIDSAKQARKDFINYFGGEPLDITDLWSTEEAKAVTSKMLKSLGYDAISVTEQGVDTYGLIK